MSYRYYSTKRPIMPGGYPKPQNNVVKEIVNFDERTFVEEINREAWGYIEYKMPLICHDIINYELTAVKTVTLPLKYLGKDSWGRYVYEDEYGKLWKNTNCGTPRKLCEERGDVLYTSSGNKFDGEPDCPMAAHIQAFYVSENEDAKKEDVEESVDSSKRKFTLEETQKFYDFLRGEGDVGIETLKKVILPEYNIWTEKSHLPKLTDEQAFLVIYVLQEVYGVIPDSYEQCSRCGKLYDSYEDGGCYEEECYCDECYSMLEISEDEE